MTQSQLKVWQDFNASNIPSDIQDELQAMGDQETDSAWRTGEIVIEMLAWADAERVEIPRMRLYKAVAVWRKKSSETVRTYYYAASKCPPEVYKDPVYQMLGFAQFKSLVPICGADEGKYRERLDKWLEYVQEPKTPEVTSVDGIRGWLNAEEGGPSIALKRHRRVMIAAERMVVDADVPGPIQYRYKDFLLVMEIVIDDCGLEEWRV